MGSLKNQQYKIAARAHNSDPETRQGSVRIDKMRESTKSWMLGTKLKADLPGPHGKRHPHKEGHS